MQRKIIRRNSNNDINWPDEVHPVLRQIYSAIWDLPVLYACVNNGYAISMPVGQGHASADIIDLARGYGFRCDQVDGNDIVMAYEKVAEAIEHIRGGNGPYFLEFKTWRWQGIFAGEFRPDDEVKYWKEDHDPILMAADRLLDAGSTREELDLIEKETHEVIEEWISFAKESPTPELAKATADVYVDWEVHP